MKRSKVVIIGSGPAGYTAAIYAARANLSPVVFEGFYSGTVGGQLMTTTDVENYPGFPEGIGGPELMIKFREQAVRFGAELLGEDVLSIDLQTYPFLVKGKETSCLADTVIVATGATAKRLDVEGTRDGEFWQKGVTACAVCDGAAPLFRHKRLFVIGGGDTAMEEALFLTRFASEVVIVHRRDEFRASKIMAKRVLEHPKIRVAWSRVLHKVEGDQVVRKVVLQSTKDQSLESHEAAGVFFATGHTPNTAFLQGQISLNAQGYIEVEPGTTRTPVEGVFAAGDVQDHYYRQAVTAAGTGCMAAMEAERWLASKEV